MVFIYVSFHMLSKLLTDNTQILIYFFLNCFYFFKKMFFPLIIKEKNKSLSFRKIIFKKKNLNFIKNFYSL